MSRNGAFFLKVAVVFLIFFSCTKKNEDKCYPTDNYLFYLYMTKVSGVLASNPYDTAAFYSNVYKSNAGSQMPLLKINGRKIQLTDDGNSRCQSGSMFNSDGEIIPNVQQTGYFRLGETNIIELTGERCGYMNEQFKLPAEPKLKPLHSNVISKSQDLVLEFEGVNDYPVEILNTDDPSSFFDNLSLHIIYGRSFSDTIAYPSLPKPVETIGVGRLLTSGGNMQIRISASELQRFPLNGTVSLELRRVTQVKLPNRTKGGFHITCRQIQGDYFEIKN